MMKILKLNIQATIVLMLILSFLNLNSADMKGKDVKAKVSLGEENSEFHFRYWEVKNDSLSFKYKNSNKKLQIKTVHVNHINSFKIDKGSYAMEGFFFAYIPSTLIMTASFTSFMSFTEGLVFSLAFSSAPGLIGAFIGSSINKWNEIKFIKSNGKETSMLINPTYIQQADAVGLNLSIKF